MHEHRRGGCPRLTIDIFYARLRHYAGGTRGLNRIEINAQVVFASSIRVGCKILRVLFPVFAALNPPGNPCAEDEVAAIRRRVLRRSGGHMPSHLCVSKSATRIVRGRYSRIRMIAYEERPFARLRRDLEFGATKLLHLKVVI